MNPPLWRWQELCQATNTEIVDGPEIRGISIDSRTLEPGDLFIALSGDPGPRFHSSGGAGRDGHEFIEAAVAAGAAGVLVSKPIAEEAPSITVPDTLDALWSLGAAARYRLDASGARVVAITGSSGKTTAKQWLRQLLQHAGETHGSDGSLNNHWGVPLSLARTARTTEFGIYEIGTNNSGEIGPLSRLVSPHVALVLNVLPAHLGRFESLDAIRVEKLCIAEGLSTDGTLIAPYGLNVPVETHARIVTFGLDPRADVSGVAKFHGGRSDVGVTAGGGSWHFSLSVGGEHRVLTALSVFAMILELGVDPKVCLSEFDSLTTPSGRGNTVFAREVAIIDDSYNANPVSVRFALEALAAMPGQRVAILGEMLELGNDGARLHQGIAEACADLDGVITVGDGYADWQHSLGDRYWGHVKDAASLDLASLISRIQRDAVVLVKGANKVFWTNGFVGKLAAALNER